MTSKVLKELYKSRNPLMILMGLKNLDFDSAYKKIGQALQHPLAKNLFFQQNYLPNSYSNIRDVKKHYFSHNLEGEIAWLLKTVILYKDKLNDFFILEEDFQRNILLNNYQEAEKIIEKINQNICFSDWSMENLFSLKDRKKGNKENWDFLKDINTNITSSISLLYSEFFSKKAEKEVSTLQYKRELENVISGLDENDAEIFIFRLGSIFYSNYNHLDLLVFMENYSSIIDKYVLLIEIMYILSSKEEHKELVTKIATELKINKFEDYRIDRILEINNSVKLINDFNEEILSLFDLYTQGDYKSALDECVKLIKSYPYCLELYETYVKCLLELSCGFEETGISKNIDEILKSLFTLYSKGDNFYEAEEILIKYYLNFSKCSFFKQLISLTLNLSGSDLVNNLLLKSYFVYSKYSNPSIMMWDNQNDLFFDEITLEKYLCLKVNFYLGIGDYDGINSLVNIPEIKRNIYKARVGFYFPQKFEIDIVEKLYQNDNLPIHTFEEVLIYLSQNFIENDKIGELLEICVDAHFKNKFLLKRLRTQELISIIVENNYFIEQANINLPLYFYITNSDSYFLFAALDVYLNSIGKTKPSEIELLDTDDEKNKKIFLLEKISSLEVLNNFYLIFENDNEVLEERINILRKLIQYNEETNSDRFFEEMAVLLRKKKVDSTLQDYNNGKISLNFERIKEENISSLETSFNRFIKLRDYTEKNDLKIVEADILIKRYLTEFESRNEDFQDASFVAFKSIFLEMVNVFLFSKEHGLDGDLSTRIRHGVLENKLRFVFTNNHLISVKNNEIYADANYWNEIFANLEYFENILENVQNKIKIFSKKIDDLIFKIKDDYIQIKSYKHYTKEGALFNYIFSEETLWLLYKEVNTTIISYFEFQNYCFNFLKNYTETVLKQISRIIQNELKNEFFVLIDEFEKEIDSIDTNGIDILLEIKQKIKFARTQIENELLEISKWFKLTSFFDAYTLDMETIVHTSLEIINNNNNTKVSPEIVLANNYLLENGYAYIEVFKILIENALKHSKVEADDLDLKIVIKEPIFVGDKESDIMSVLVFSLSNKINKEVYESSDVNYISENWNSSPLINVNVEGGSGYQKINRLLKYGLKVLDSKVTFDITENRFNVELTIFATYNNIDDEI